MDSLTACAHKSRDADMKERVEELKSTIVERNLLHKDQLDRYLFSTIDRVPKKKIVNSRDSLLREEDGFL